MSPHIPPAAPVRLVRFGGRILLTGAGLVLLIVLFGWTLRPDPPGGRR